MMLIFILKRFSMQSQNFLVGRYKLHGHFMLKIFHGLFSTCH